MMFFLNCFNPLSKHSAFRSEDVGLKHCVIWVLRLLELWDVLSHAIKMVKRFRVVSENKNCLCHC